MPTRTESAEMNKIVTNSEIHLRHYLCQPRGFKNKYPPEVFNKKGVLLNTFFIENFTKLTGKHLRPSPTQVFSWQFFEIFENTFFNRTLPGNCFSWMALMVKNVNSVSLIFPNSQLYHGLPEWWLLFQYNENHYVIKKTWPNFKSQTLSMTLFQKQSSSKGSSL